ncbi:hypothetical protein ABB37_09604 [Leptomonas pyrrhocoris]|uniref:Uncharacterized protein n=1 Tax=Leptomonas pyrrhocoris TaxID=157538 RepID=A0A0M9FQ89_LEPPY|nr:hypothetical protein ABB37_09604 [Leptomonas pyrrhocoris]XP_015652106.1 hypothetical protein ABB37_09604 [Leptomonas pyrrhocoris]KPA73666.1 hypothetical protein ABB37_09604 [Leptomonas pyrrhocoris]KPA73667.1 hypothetical protein ABB37_09604 [Leptomonas pyrrhocoris]|eukprot:XP_015652105.1 hypothetical protein ABB37_09604 [Leptomonas pyrrhocoris]
MYRTAPQIVFQVVGGFSVAQYAYPVLYDSYKHPQTTTTTTSTANASGVPSVSSVSGMWGKMRWDVRMGGSASPRTLSEDVESLLTSYRAVSAALLTFVVVSGGAPALIGAGISIYCDGGPAGTARYEKLKQKWREFNK